MIKTFLIAAHIMGLLFQPLLEPGSPPEKELTGLKFVPPEQLRGIPLAELPFGGFSMPERVDLARHMPPPGHQSEQNSCVAWVSAYAVKTYQEKLEQQYQLVSQGQPDWRKIFSPAFVYNQINQGRDGGATLVDALNLLSARGALSWADMPYNPDNFTLQPTATQLKQARRFRISYWRRVNVQDPQEVKAHLQAGYPVMVGLIADEGLYRLKGQNVWKKRQGKILGGHAVVVVGYDERREAFKIMNSWGSRWADRGYGWVDYGFFRKMVREGYVAKDALNQVPVEMVNRPAPAAPEPNILSESAPERDEKSKKNEIEEDDDNVLFDNMDLGQLEPGAGSEEERASDVPLLRSRSAHAEAPLPPSRIHREAEGSPILKIQRVSQERGQLQFEGWARLRPEQGRKARVLVKLFTDAKGQKPLFLPRSTYRLPNQQGVALGDEKPVQEQFHWQASIPLDQFRQRRRLWAQAVLYLDNFGVETGALKDIEVQP